MDSKTNGDAVDLGALKALREELISLQQRVAALESERAAQSAPLVSAKAAAGPPLATEDLLVIISAALAAHLGVKPHIRQMRLLGGASWAQVGRVTIQASHALPVR